MAAANRNHGVDCHNAGLHRLTHAAPLDDSRSNLLDRIKGFRFHRPFAVQRLAKRVHHPPEQAFAHRDLKQPSGDSDFNALRDFHIVAQKNRADFGFFEIESETVNTVGKFDHLIQHHVA